MGYREAERIYTCGDAGDDVDDDDDDGDDDGDDADDNGGGRWMTMDGG